MGGGQQSSATSIKNPFKGPLESIGLGLLGYENEYQKNFKQAKITPPGTVGGGGGGGVPIPGGGGVPSSGSRYGPGRDQYGKRIVVPSASMEVSQGARDDAFSRLLFNPERFQQIGDSIANTAFGGNLDVANTTAGRSLIDALTAKNQQVMDKNQAMLESRAALAGHSSTGRSGRLMQLGTQANTRGAENLQSILAPQLFQQYGQERGLQEAAQERLKKFEQTPGETAFSIASNFQKQGSSSGK